MKVVVSKSVTKPVILMKILEDNSLLVVDSETTVRYFNIKNLKLQGGFKVGIKHKYYKTPVVAFSKNGEYFATLTADAKESRLFNTKSKKMIAKVTRHHGEVSCVGIDPLSRYMFSSGDDGKTFAIDIRSGKLVFTLPHHVDTINDIAFSPNGNWVATASYDRKIALFSLLTMTPKSRLKSHSAPIMHLKFFHKHKLISIDKQFSAIIWNIYSGKVIERLQGIHDEVTAVVIDNEEQFLFLGTKLGYIIVYELENYSLISEKYIKITSPITSLEFDSENDFLIIGTEDGFVMYYDIYEGTATLKELLQKKEFGLIQTVVDTNPLLVYTEIYGMLTNFWESTLKKATLALQNRQRDKAILMLKSFKELPSKNRIIQKLLRDYEEYEKFITLAKQQKLALAYSLLNKYPIYKESKIYKLLEDQWKKTLYEAQKYVIRPNGIDRAKELLAPYRGISEKTPLIQDVLTKGEVYKRFKEALVKKNFSVSSELVRQYSFLREYPEYDNMMKYADTLYVKAHQLIASDKNIDAMKYLRVLEDFGDFKEEARKLMKMLDSKEKFYEAIEKENYAIAYNMMVNFEELEDTKAGKRLIAEWNKDMALANSFAVNGDANGVKDILQKYFKVSSKSTAIATIFAWCYINQLENALDSNESRKKIENGIKNYILNFGADDQIEMFFEVFKKNHSDTKLNIEFLKKGSLSMWKPSMIVESILE
jgi:WD40 repeat protein